MDRLIYGLEHINWGLGYIITILIFVASSILSKLYKNNKFMYIFLLYLIAFSSTRDIVNFDMRNYKEMYENYKFLSMSQVEPGFIFLCWVLNHFTSSPYLLFSTYSLQNILFVYFGIKNFTPYVKSSFFLFLTIPMLYLLTLIGIRQSLAEAIMFFATSLLFRGKKLLFLLFGILAVLFHYSAIVVFIITGLIYLIFKNKVKPKFMFLILIVSLMINFLSLNKFLLEISLKFLFPLLPEKYSIYAQLLLTEGKTALTGFSIYTTSLFNILTMLTSYYSVILLRMGCLRKNYGLIINLLLIGTVYMNLFGKFSDVTARIFYYFIFYYVILIPFIIYKMFRNQINKVLIVYALSLFLFIWLFSGIYKQLTPNEPPPLIYKNILLKDIF
jgi:hypothetical protein